MAVHRILALLLVGLVIVASLQPTVQETAPSASAWRHFAWTGFLFWLPLILAGFLLKGARWALMAGVMYGTIGLALDIATVVQALTGPGTESKTLLMSGTTSLLNFLVIALGGRGLST